MSVAGDEARSDIAWSRGCHGSGDGSQGRSCTAPAHYWLVSLPPDKENNSLKKHCAITLDWRVNCKKRTLHYAALVLFGWSVDVSTSDSSTAAGAGWRQPKATGWGQSQSSSEPSTSALARPHQPPIFGLSNPRGSHRSVSWPGRHLGSTSIIQHLKQFIEHEERSKLSQQG